jgi:adenine/guanine phosphoribosyltransferase-like PRPP-binding protein
VGDATIEATGVAAGSVWCGRWVSDRLGVELLEGDSRVGMAASRLAGLALRHNPRRAHLLVSTVLGKHIPADPRVVRDAGLLLGGLVAARLGASPPRGVLGFAETATALGHCVADSLGAAWYLHSTRREVPGYAQLAAFEEVHSHASTHLLLPADPEILESGEEVVLVDDELSTGRTAANTITALHTLRPRRRYVVAALLDVRPSSQQDPLQSLARDLDADIDVVSLAHAEVRAPAGIGAAASELTASFEEAAERPSAPARATTVCLDGCWPAGVREGARHGWSRADSDALEETLPGLAQRVADACLGSSVLALGTEELMYAPLRLACALSEEFEARTQGVRVRFSSTTRSPVLAVDDPGYAIRSRLRFPAHDGAEDGGARFAYNIAPSPSQAAWYDTIVCVLDPQADSPAAHASGGLLEKLAGCCARLVVLVVGTP